MKFWAICRPCGRAVQVEAEFREFDNVPYGQLDKIVRERAAQHDPVCSGVHAMTAVMR